MTRNMRSKYPGDAVLSECGKYRYRLEREMLALGASGAVAFVMLNPSTADHRDDDPTIKKCISYAMRWKYQRLFVGNLFALRSPEPAELGRQHAAGVDVVGPHNDIHLEALVEEADLVVCAWGVHGYDKSLPVRHPPPCTSAITATTRAAYVRMLLNNARILRAKKPLHYLKLTNDRYPYHPLYLKGDLEPTEWK